MREKLKKFGAEEILERAELYGRTFVDENKEKLFALQHSKSSASVFQIFKFKYILYNNITAETITKC